MDKERLRDLLWEATVDCHDEDEEFTGIFYTLAEQGLNFPLEARAFGDLVEVVDLDGAGSGLRRGIVTLVRKGDREYPVALADLVRGSRSRQRRVAGGVSVLAGTEVGYL